MMKSFQDIYDFCLSDNTWNVYHNAPDPFSFTSPGNYKYYFGEMKGLSRNGTFYYRQAAMQLKRFLGFSKEDYYIHVDPGSYRQVDFLNHYGTTIYIISHITGKGVEVQFAHPLKSRCDRITFIARSHRKYNASGLIEEVKTHINKKLLFPSGRYRELQLQYKVPKEDFIEWYRIYKKNEKDREDEECMEMLDKYSVKEKIHTSFEESMIFLESFGVFHNLGMESEEEKEELAFQFMNMPNR